jgi:hypothetical protein
MNAQATAQTAVATPWEGTMKPGAHLAAALAIAAALTSVGASAAPGDTTDLALRRVLLSSGGVGYFDYEATLDGAADLHLSVRRDQVDDVLKSLVISDDVGKLGEVSLPGKEPVSEAFRDLPLSEATLASPSALLSALRGAEVRVETAGSVLIGRIISVTEEQARKAVAGETVTQHRLSVLSEGALHQLVIEDIDSIKVLDPALQKQIDDALDALSRQRERDRRDLVIHLGGEGARVVRVGYVAEVPLWKSTYRLVLPPVGVTESASLTGFAVVENRTGEPWNEVDLTLVSGNPVTFKQAIYDAYYVARPTVPVEVIGRVLPQRDEGGIALAAAEGGDLESAPAAEPMAADGASSFFGGGFHHGGLRFGMPMMTAEKSAPKVAAIDVATTREDATQVVFNLPTPVTLAAGQTALLPVLTLSVPATRISLYQPETEARHPLSSIEIMNSSPDDLPPGVVAIYDRATEGGALSYAGDAQLALLPSGKSRFVSYAVDLRVTIDKAESDTEEIARGTIADGVLTLTRTEQKKTVYTIAGAAHEARTVLLEHPRIEGFTLVPPADTTLVETTDTSYRLKREVPANTTVTVTVILERDVGEAVILTSTSTSQIVAYASTTGLTDEVRAALSKIVERRTDVAAKETTLSQKTAERARILEDQARLRENLKAVPAGSDLAKKYLKRMDDQEQRLSALDDEITAANTALGVARAALAAEIASLRI